MSDEKKTETKDELNSAQLNDVSGGFGMGTGLPIYHFKCKRCGYEGYGSGFRRADGVYCANCINELNETKVTYR